MTYSTRQFTFDRQTNTFVTDASDLGWRPGITGFRQIYPDSCDEGLTLVSHKTGRECNYVVVESNDRYWKLKPVDGLKGNVGRGTFILIAND